MNEHTRAHIYETKRRTKHRAHGQPGRGKSVSAPIQHREASKRPQLALNHASYWGPVHPLLW